MSGPVLGTRHIIENEIEKNIYALMEFPFRCIWQAGAVSKAHFMSDGVKCYKEKKECE